MNRTARENALLAAMAAGVLLVLLASIATAAALAELITYDFTGKIAGSSVENPHVAYSVDTVTPDESPGTILAQVSEFSQVEYDGIEEDDTTYASLPASGAWVEVGVASASGEGLGAGFSPSLALRAPSTPYIAWTAWTPGDTPVRDVCVKYFDGVAWAEVGDCPISSPGSYLGDIDLDSSGNPYVVWTAPYPNYEIYVKRYDGTNWVEVGSGSATGAGISNSGGRSHGPSLVLDGSGNPYVAWTLWTSNNANPQNIYIKRFDGTNWVEVGSGSASGGGISDSSVSSSGPSLALDGADNPYVAWMEYLPQDNSEIYIKRFDGTNWVEVGTGSASGGGISNNSGTSGGCSMALDTSANPYVAWHDTSGGDYEIYIKHFDGASWVEVGSGSASGGGMSDTGGGSQNVTLALDASGRPYVAWADGTYPDYEIYIKRFDGTNWVEVGTASASGGGISDNSGVSWNPSLALDNSGWPYVAWEDETVWPSHIYVRRLSGTYAEHLYSFRLSEGTIDQMVPSVLAYGTAITDGVTAQLWDNASFSWEMVGSSTDSSMPSTPISATFSLTPTKYVDASNRVHLLVRTTYPSRVATSATLYVDYVSLEVDYESLSRPSGTISINKGALSTTSPDVLLDLFSDGATYMRFSNDGANYTAWEACATSKSWTLSSGDGPKIGYVEYRDASVASAVYTDTIVLDTSVGTWYGVSINEGALFTNQITVTLSLGAPAYTAQMMVSNDGGFAGATWEPYATHREWQITQYGEYVIPRSVYVKYKDTEGTISSTYQDDIILDVTPPTGSIEVVPGVGTGVAAGSSGGISSTSDYPYNIFFPHVLKGYPPVVPNVTLVLTADDDVSGVGYMVISNDPSFGGASWEPYVASKPWHVNETGTATVYVKYRDNAGNVSEVYSDTIVVGPNTLPMHTAPSE